MQAEQPIALKLAFVIESASRPLAHHALCKICHSLLLPATRLLDWLAQLIACVLCGKVAPQAEPEHQIASPFLSERFLQHSATTIKGQMEEALKSSSSARSGSYSMSARQLVDSMPVHDLDDRNPSRPSKLASTSTSTTFPMHAHAERGGAVAMSIPAILKQNVPGFRGRSARVAQLQSSSNRSMGTDKLDEAHEKARQKLGRRKQRRWENAHFYGSKHMVPPHASDYSPAQLSTDPIFPSPPPSRFFPYKPSSDPIADPNARQAPTFDDSVTSADHGRFSLPMRGLKRNTRRIVAEGGIGGDIVQAVDAELRGWLEGTEAFISPETMAYNNAHNLNSGRKCICEVDTDHGRMQAVNQLAKQPHALVWQSEDSFTRFLIHAIARYYRVVSFSEVTMHTMPSAFTDNTPVIAAKPDPTTASHLIWLLRPSMAPKVTQDPASKPTSGFDTPPTTASEWEASSIGNLTTSASELESIASGSGIDMLSADEDASADEPEAGLEDHDGDVTIVELEEEDAVLLSTGPSNRPSTSAAGSSTRRSTRKGRPSMGRTLSDIDSGAEVDDERDAEDEAAGAKLIRQRMLDLAVSDRAATPGGHSSSRISTNRPYRTVPVQPTRRIGSKGWRLPERTFADWVLAS